MSYELHAVVASPEALTPIVERFDHAHPALLDGGELAMVPMCADLFAAIDLVGFPLAAESGFERLSPGVAAVLTAASRYGPVAYLECDYVGGIGWRFRFGSRRRFAGRRRSAAQFARRTVRREYSRSWKNRRRDAAVFQCWKRERVCACQRLKSRLER